VIGRSQSVRECAALQCAAGIVDSQAVRRGVRSAPRTFSISREAVRSIGCATRALDPHRGTRISLAEQLQLSPRRAEQEAAAAKLFRRSVELCARRAKEKARRSQQFPWRVQLYGRRVQLFGSR
jgi:hypothetical protein